MPKLVCPFYMVGYQDGNCAVFQKLEDAARELGFAFRPKQLARVDDSTDSYVEVWATIVNGRLFVYDDLPSETKEVIKRGFKLEY